MANKIAQTASIGYKQTEVGVIPKDWDVKEINKLGEIRGRVGWKGYTVKDLRDSGPYTIGAKHINKSNQLDLSDPTHLSIEKYLESPEIMVNKGDLLIVQRGTIGKLVLIDKEIGDATINPSMAILRFRKAVESYIYYYLCSEKGQSQILQDTSSTGVPMITQKQISNFKIPTPPTLEEQTAIATVLSDIDVLIEKLEKLIAKKRAIKQGAMQELLTGKRRLPGFSGKWETIKLGDVGKCFAGGTPSTFNSSYWDGTHIWLPSGRVQNNIIRKIENEITITQRGLDESAAKLIKSKAILIAITGATCGNIGLLEFEAAANQSVVAIEPFDNYDYRFLYYSLLMKRAVILSGRGGSAQGGVNLYTVKNIEVMFPIKTEQIAISQVLSDMDAEIETLEQKLDKYEMLKQGMMQVLLNGKVRLV